MYSFNTITVLCVCVCRCGRIQRHNGASWLRYSGWCGRRLSRLTRPLHALPMMKIKYKWSISGYNIAQALSFSSRFEYGLLCNCRVIRSAVYLSPLSVFTAVDWVVGSTKFDMTLEEIEFFFVTPTFAIKQNWNKIVPLFSLCPVRSNCANNGQQLANISINFDLSIRLNLQMRTHNSMEILDKENDIQISHRTCYLCPLFRRIHITLLLLTYICTHFCNFYIVCCLNVA